MWAWQRFEKGLEARVTHRRLRLDAADRVLETVCSKAPSQPAANAGINLRDLTGQTGWANLDPAIRRRFASEPVPGETTLYRGTMQTVGCSWFGWMIAQAGRLIGTPMTWRTGADVPCDVHVYGDETGGLTCERRYDFGKSSPLVAKTTKRNGGGVRLLECFGCGVGMTLRVFERDKSLHFVSEGFVLNLGGRRLTLPNLLGPGTLHVTQSAEGERDFRFTMEVNHPIFGRVAWQTGVFHEAGG